MFAKFLEEDFKERFTEAAKVALALAQEESCRIGHKVVGTEQLLIRLIAVDILLSELN